MIRSLYIDEQGQISSDVPMDDYPRILESRRGLLWVDMEHPDQMAAVQLLTGVFKFHTLAVEDCFHALQYARIDSYGDYAFVVAHGLKGGENGKVEKTELDFFLGPNYLVSFRSEPMPAIEAVIKSAIKHPLRLQRGVDWLVHAILDAIVDDYLPVIEQLSSRLEGLEEEAMRLPRRETLAELLAAKRDVLTIHRAAVPFRELISRFSREELPHIKAATQPYFRDVYDHLVRVTETSETLREVAEGALTIFAMSQNNHTSEVIRGLTVAATLALPSIMIASIYGMNFKHMPELDWRYGYLYVLLATAGISAGVLGLLRYKKWL